MDKEGWLTKSGSNGRNWKRRWCVVKESIIYYFRTEKESREGAPLGVIPLQDCKLEEGAVSNGVKTVAIHTRHRTYKLQADPETMAEWIELIHDSVRALGSEQGDNSSRRARKIEALANAQTMEMSYKTNVAKVVVVASWARRIPHPPHCRVAPVHHRCE